MSVREGLSTEGWKHEDENKGDRSEHLPLSQENLVQILAPFSSANMRRSAFLDSQDYEA